MSGSRWRDKPVVVRAPASSANLGPGFDALGLALSLHDVAVARVTDGGLDIEVSGEGSETAAAGEAHLVVRAMRAAFDVLGAHPPGLGLRTLNAIPHGRGLGSSAAAIVTGILAARGLARDGAELLPDGAVLALAASLEGHPDNVAACLHGGLTISWTPDPARPDPGPPASGRPDVAGPDLAGAGDGPAPPPRRVPASSACRCWRRSGRWFSLRRKAWPRTPRGARCRPRCRIGTRSPTPPAARCWSRR